MKREIVMRKLDVGLRRTRKDLRAALAEVPGALLRASAFGKISQYDEVCARVKTLKQKYRDCKEAMRVGC